MALTSEITQNEVILVGGCSFTVQPYRKSDPNIPYLEQEILIDKTWSTYIQCKKLINEAKVGRGNHEIIKYILQYMFENPNEKIDRVIVALSEWKRFYTPQRSFVMDYVWYSKEKAEKALYALNNNLEYKAKFHTNSDIELWWQMRMGKPNREHLRNIITDTFINLNALYLICKSKNIKLHVFQLLEPFPTFREKSSTIDEYKMLIDEAYYWMGQNSSQYEILNSNKVDLYGFPFLTELGGKLVWRMIGEKIPLHKLRISDSDDHPSEYGHKVLYETIVNNLKDFKL